MGTRTVLHTIGLVNSDGQPSQSPLSYPGMGVRAILVVCMTAFFLGTLTTHWIADSLTMWQPPLTIEHLRAAASYYAFLATMPLYMQYFLAAAAVTGAFAILLNFSEWGATNLFDWACLFLYGFTAFIYVYSALPNIQSLSVPLPYESSTDEATFPFALRNPLLELAASHLFCSVALTGVIFLQGGRWWAEGQDETWESGAEERRRLRKKAKAEAEAAAAAERAAASVHGGKKKGAKRKRGLLRGLRSS